MQISMEFCETSIHSLMKKMKTGLAEQQVYILANSASFADVAIVLDTRYHEACFTSFVVPALQQEDTSRYQSRQHFIDSRWESQVR